MELWLAKIIITISWPRFNSIFTESKSVDTPVQNWLYKSNWVCQPVLMVLHAVDRLLNWRASGPLIIPELKSAHFWSVIRPQPNKFVHFVENFRYLGIMKNLIIPGLGQSRICTSHKSIFDGCPSFNMLALRIKF